jgi:hypothetical protein
MPRSVRPGMYRLVRIRQTRVPSLIPSGAQGAPTVNTFYGTPLSLPEKGLRLQGLAILPDFGPPPM